MLLRKAPALYINNNIICLEFLPYYFFNFTYISFNICLREGEWSLSTGTPERLEENLKYESINY